VHQREVLPNSLAFNLYPQVDVFMPSGYTREEDKMLYETRKIMGLPELPLEVTCVRVPVARCHSEAVSVEFAAPVTVAAARAALAAFPGVEVLDDPSSSAFPQPESVTGRDDVVVGRIRESRVFEHGLMFWVVGDQLLKGAALNAVQIAERL
jgi:aspartate-semialdehyde dehydrogenase